MKIKQTYGYGRVRSGDPSGIITNYHLNPYVNCIHQSAGGLADHVDSGGGGL